ncbi:hypothetical protein [Cupriavidus sp. D384]|uniref:hypothetical protein n=1 Tax=Cupriavidus sp. D384 TaxID=1538095 RepID=UPI00082EBAE2|nr:hypothetical protein [Cupriavidus sp. D384]
MTTPQIILSIGAVFVVIGIIGWCLVRAGTLGEDDPEVYADADGETTPSRHLWKNAGMKAHHAEPR